MNNNFFTFLQEFYGSLSIPLLICAVIFFIGLTLLFWTLFISEGTKRTKLIKCLIFGGVPIAAYILLWYIGITLASEPNYGPNVLSLIIAGCVLLVVAIVSLVLVLFKYKKNKVAYLVPWCLFDVSLTFLNLSWEIPASYSLYSEVITEKLDPSAIMDRAYAIVYSILFCAAVVVWLWIRFASEGEKRKKLWISGGVVYAIFILMVISCFFSTETVNTGRSFLSDLLMALMLCLEISAIVSLCLVLWRRRKDRRAYLVPLIMYTVAQIYSIVLYIGLWIFLLWAFRNW